jgi:hypothetical protein
MGNYKRLISQVRTIDNESAPYGALRFVSGMFNIIGFVVIIIHTILMVMSAYPYILEKLGDQLIALAITVLAWGIGTIFGIVIIAQGQMLELMLDIRNDMYLTRRYVRRFGLHMAREVESAEEETEAT